MSDVASGPGWELRCGRWQDVLADVREVDALISDPPYGQRTHEGNDSNAGRQGRSVLNYAFWSPIDVSTFVAHWSPITRSWMSCMTSDDLIQAWRESYDAAGRFDFAPVPILQHRPRLTGDGPGSGTVYKMVARPRDKRFMGWGSLPCWYLSQPAKDGVAGGKPLDLMRAIVRDYTRPGDLVCDPCAGGSTTLLAAVMEGRRAIGAEMDPQHFLIGKKRLEKGFTPPLFTDSGPRATQESLMLGDDDGTSEPA